MQPVNVPSHHLPYEPPPTPGYYSHVLTEPAPNDDPECVATLKCAEGVDEPYFALTIEGLEGSWVIDARDFTRAWAQAVIAELVPA